MQKFKTLQVILCYGRLFRKLFSRVASRRPVVTGGARYRSAVACAIPEKKLPERDLLKAQRKLLFRCYEKTLYFEIYAKQAEHATVRGAGLT